VPPSTEQSTKIADFSKYFGDALRLQISSELQSTVATAVGNTAAGASEQSKKRKVIGQTSAEVSI
jgi:hypothetical protein